jgi:hypothetical protein
MFEGAPTATTVGLAFSLLGLPARLVADAARVMSWRESIKTVSLSSLTSERGGADGSLWIMSLIENYSEKVSG